MRHALAGKKRRGERRGGKRSDKRRRKTGKQELRDERYQTLDQTRAPEPIPFYDTGPLMPIDTKPSANHRHRLISPLFAVGASQRATDGSLKAGRKPDRFLPFSPVSPALVLALILVVLVRSPGLQPACVSPLGWTLRTVQFTLV